MAAVAAQRRPLGALGRMGMVAGLHVAVLFVIARSLGIGVTKVEPPPPIDARVIDQPRPPAEPPRVPEPDVSVTQQSFVIPDPDMAHLEFETDTLTGPPPDAIYEEDPPPVAVPQPKIVDARPDPRRPLSKPEYSARMIREGNQGTIEVEVFVQPDGRVADARVVKSTGYAELDLAAIAEAKRNWRLIPATQDGKPIAQWHRLRVTFKLNER
jgi:periplasmic protein TonB